MKDQIVRKMKTVILVRNIFLVLAVPVAICFGYDSITFLSTDYWFEVFHSLAFYLLLACAIIVGIAEFKRSYLERKLESLESEK